MPTLLVKAKPNARLSSLTRQDDGTWLAQLKSAPVDGKANAELIGLVARHFGCAKSSVSIRTGAGSKLKRVEIPD
ncbi:MAG TPA: DUF167 domain-containing protein [Thermomonas sp.]|jgi:hypothetical protein|uniref:DUF167 domain-containing protein n=1 Tax=Thermomonas sp. TaxID=1971895 RepID=UPI002D191846|nr:DUF167 domain-containing protein [Thermomonas sp.]HOZ25410.1 DUF167 domain-containing protein [Thermomonas sp.]HPM56317.1 DUF167 domain-containing protein [Thermomonas sp.]HPW13181.1 DUF167 domain-containing protein [Thermomonas sp.]